MNAKDVIKAILGDGWEEVPRRGSSHRHFKHPDKPGKVTIAFHGSKDIPLSTLKSIEKQSGVKMT